MKCTRFASALVASWVCYSQLLGDYSVTSTADDGSSGTLRWALNQANAMGGGTVAFDVTGLIALGSNLPPLNATGSVAIQGTAGLVIDGRGLYEPFFIQGGTVSISNLTIQNAAAIGGPGAQNTMAPFRGGGGGLGVGFLSTQARSLLF